MLQIYKEGETLHYGLPCQQWRAPFLCAFFHISILAFYLNCNFKLLFNLSITTSVVHVQPRLHCLTQLIISRLRFEFHHEPICTNIRTALLSTRFALHIHWLNSLTFLLRESNDLYIIFKRDLYQQGGRHTTNSAWSIVRILFFQQLFMCFVDCFSSATFRH